MTNAYPGRVVLCWSDNGSVSSSAVSPRGKGFRFVSICAEEAEAGADVGPLVWKGIQEWGAAWRGRNRGGAATCPWCIDVATAG